MVGFQANRNGTGCESRNILIFWFLIEPSSPRKREVISRMDVSPQEEILAVIPARYGSTRFPGKVLAQIEGKPLIYYTYNRALMCELITNVVIATDDDRVVAELSRFGIEVVMTRPDHESGTDRIAEVAASSKAEIIVNIQGDEPLIDPRTVDSAIRALLENPDSPMSTVRRRFVSREEVENPNNVKVVCDSKNRALYFSRYPIPYVREDVRQLEQGGVHWHHYGLYAYRRDFLLQYTKLPQTPLEKLEKLEQLRVLEHGYSIVVADTEYESIGVDTPHDLEIVAAKIVAARKLAV